MKARRLLFLTAIVSSILGGVAVYLALTVPNDLKADAMLKVARKNIEGGRRDSGREELIRIVQHYPRTDAAAAATVALVKLADEERKELSAAIADVRNENAQQAQALSAIQQKLAAPAPAPAPAAATAAPEVKAAPARPKPSRKATQRRKATPRRHRRRRR